MMTEHLLTEEEKLPRWDCKSYCRCRSRKGAFEPSKTGVWVLYADAQQRIEALEKELKAYREHGQESRRI